MDTEILRRTPLFAELDDGELAWLVAAARTVDLAAGDCLMREGDMAASLFVVLAGEFDVTKSSADQDVFVARRGPGEVMGEQSLLEMSPRGASVTAVRPSRVLEISQDVFLELLATHPRATLAVLHTITSRLRQTEAMVRQNEKMAALGTLAAGLAHELNNPAAAARRGADQLRGVLSDWQERSAELDALELDDAQRAEIRALRDGMARRAEAPLHLDPLDRSDRESELQDWLEDRGVDEAWILAPALVPLGWDVDSLDALARRLGADHMGTVVCWLAATGMVYALLDEVRTSAERVSAIVTAVKSYAYLDQAPVQDVDLHESLDNTLLILRHKLKQGVHVRREYAADLPRVEAYASDLKQVWTNIIDNAIDAMDGSGELVLRTMREGERVVVEVGDDGPGIPVEAQERVFEPFFTTKPPGKGTGLGLHISYNVIQKHHGRLTLRSRPGETVFRVELPVEMNRGE